MKFILFSSLLLFFSLSYGKNIQNNSNPSPLIRRSSIYYFSNNYASPPPSYIIPLLSKFDFFLDSNGKFNLLILRHLEIPIQPRTKKEKLSD